MVMPRFDGQDGSEIVSNGISTTGDAAVNRNHEVPSDHLEQSPLGIQIGDEMPVDPIALAIGTGTSIVAAPSQTIVTGSMDTINYDADHSDPASADEDDYFYDSDDDDDDDSSDSSVHTPTSVISHSLISSYRTIDGTVSSNSEASSSHGNSSEIFVLAECRTCMKFYPVPRGTIVCTRCGYAGLTFFRGY